MKYYSIYLPIQTDLEDIVYMSESSIPRGTRVIVSFNRKVITGICNREVPAHEIKQSVSYKPVIEVLDNDSILPEIHLSLAEWMSRYYRCSVGKALFAMLPSVVIPEINAKLNWLGNANPPREFASLYQALSDGKQHTLADIRKAMGSEPFYKTVENAEILGLVELKRSYDSKVKPKTLNYIKVKQVSPLPDLTVKQASAWQLISAKESEFPLSAITDEVTYSIIKALAAKGLLEIIPRLSEHRAVIFPEHRSRKELTLTKEQTGIIESITSQSANPTVHLIYGITGSGKTEVYIEVIRHYLQKGQNIIMLIPEIALTPQMVDRFLGAFGSMLAILHSQLTERQRFEQWQQIRKGNCRIVIGARSAVFAPLTNVGLIIVDEEHEQSYKQDNVPRYHGRDLAIVRARLEQAAVILGSATPSLESWSNAESGKYQKHMLLSRPTPQGLPEVQLLDMREEEEVDLLSQTLRDAIQNCLDKGEQVMLLQNRRGFASFVQCKNCGGLQQCPNCEISLYYHHDKDEMICHYCGYHTPIPRKCPACNSYTFAFGAPGTQKIEQLLRVYFPKAKILRLDSDSSHRKDAYSYMYDKMHSREIDILLGTQMISKGLDFPNVTLVGVVLADISLNVPDFRAAERTFNLLTQVAGRSGRGEQPGRVIIQTWNPEHYAIRYATAQDYINFAKEELNYRQRLFYPPFFRLGRMVFTGSDEKKLLALADKYYKPLEKLKLKYGAEKLLILGPSPAPLSKINKLYRYHIICKAADAETLSKAMGELETIIKLPSSISIAIDIDPVTLM
jgi:primosomal protein N' (replication factor Y)